ncbi:MAG: hypothetical protein ABJN96_07790 [Marinomonas sp.]
MMQLLATMNDNEQWQQILAGCQLEKWNSLENVSSSITDLSEAASYCVGSALTLTELADILAQPEVHILLCLSAPESLIGQRIQQGESIDRAIEAWHQQTSAVLQLQSQHRRKLQLVQIESVLSTPSGVPEWLSPTLTLTTPERSASFDNNISNLLAAQALRQSPEAEQCWQRLIASSLPLADQPQCTFDLDKINKEYVVDKNQQLAENEHEKGLFQEHLFKVQEELEQALLKNQTLTKQQADAERAAQKRLKETKEQLVKGKKELEQAQLKNQTLTKQQADAERAAQKQLKEIKEQLAKGKKELEQALLKNQTLAKQQADVERTAQKQLKETKEQLVKGKKELEQAQLKNQTLAKQQADLEKSTQKQLGEVKAHLAEKNDENELILKQLFHVQEELERFMNKHDALTQELTTAHAAIKDRDTKYQKLEMLHKQLQVQSQKEQAKLEKKLQATIAEEVHAKHTLAATRAQLSALTGSKAWRSVAPARKIISVLRGAPKVDKKLQYDISLVMSSKYFDVTWYLSQYPDVVESGVNPAEHYVRYGAKEGRSPGPLFDGDWYLSQYPDVAENNVNPLLHFIKYGEKEGRTASQKLLQHLVNPVAENKESILHNQNDKAAE